MSVDLNKRINALGGYQAVFNAIAAAVTPKATGIGISVNAFAAALPAEIERLDVDPYWPQDGTCRKCGAAPRSPKTGLCAACADEIERLTARKVGPSREAIEEAAHQAIVRWSNGEQPKPIKAMVADAIIDLLETKAVETVSAKEGRKP